MKTKFLAAALVAAALCVICLAPAALVGQETRGGRTTNSPGAAPAAELTISDAQIEAMDVSDVAALVGGVVESIELKEGTPVKKGDPIGYLYSKRALLTYEKAQLAAASKAAIEKAKAEYDLRVASLARVKNLNAKIRGGASDEEVQIKEAEVQVANASWREAYDNHQLAGAEAKIAKQNLDEHTIVAPFDGKVIERLKKPGEAVQANEPVVRLINLDKLRVFAFVPLEQSYRIREGDEVEIIPGLPKATTGGKRYFGKITFIDPEIQAVNEKTKRVYVEVDNRAHGGELSPGLSAILRILPRTSGGGSSARAD